MVDSRGVRAFCALGIIGFTTGTGGTQQHPAAMANGTYAWTYRSEHFYLSPFSGEYLILLDTSGLSDSWLSFEGPVEGFSDAIRLTQAE